jgi:predicted acylesterase/phospholipase RssA
VEGHVQPTPVTLKRVLYFLPRERQGRDLTQDLSARPGCQVRTSRAGALVSCACGEGGEAASFLFVTVRGIAEALAALHRDFFNVVLLDLREPLVAGREPARVFEAGSALLEAMDAEPDVEARYGFHRIVALVSGHEISTIDDRIAQLGLRGVGRVMRDPACPLDPGCARPHAQDFPGRVLSELVRLTWRGSKGKTALCASGGGITGLYFELGALKCLEDCLPPGALQRLDLYYGISAGGVVSGMLANGYGVTEFMAGLAGVKGGRIPPMDLNLLDARHLDMRGLTRPLRQLLGLIGQGLAGLARGRFPFTLESLIFEYGDLIHAPFNTDGFEALLREAFTRPGSSNDFRKLGGRLYVGATDQDRKVHVVFGEPPHDRVPVSRAIQASMSLNPAFAPTRLGGRYFEDGAVTRTSNFVEAIRRGADLIFALDPLVPYVSRRAGFARRRGIFYNADQDIRTVSFTRYDTTRHHVLRRHPAVSLYTFLPANRLRRLLSVNPMDYRPFLPIWRGAYLSTLRRIQTLGYRMRGDLLAHGMGLDTTRAEEVAGRLRSRTEPGFADFFPDGRIEVSEPPRLVPVESGRKRSRRAA